MSCWRVLELSEESDERIPQLLIKTDFGAKSYTVFLTDLNNIWSEESDLAAIVERATQQESPIEVSKQDTTQLAILLDNVRKCLDTDCRITRNDTDGVILHAATSLPEPLDSLRWKFYLGKRTAVTLRNELILPLLVSSHIQHERVNSLISSVTEKDKAITRLLDQFESSNLDLATAFPSIGGSKSARKLIKREQAARHVPALRPFDKDSWKKETSQLKDSQISTLGLFQEALSQCTPKVPPRMTVTDDENSWWTLIGSSLESPEPNFKSKPAEPTKTISPSTPRSETSEDETEDEFETHENFRVRDLPRKSTQAPKPTPPSAQKQQAVHEDETTEDEEDLDAPPKSQNQSLGRATTRQSSTKDRSPEPKLSPVPKPSSSSAQKPKGFRIGGAKSKEPAVELPRETSLHAEHAQEERDAEEPNASIPTRAKSGVESTTSTAVKPARKAFKIGGRHKTSTEDSAVLSPPKTSKSKGDIESAKEALVEPVPQKRSADVKTEVDTSSPAEEHEETAEEKAERKRRELKRKNEELAKKQAQNKKKKRF
ncbi:XLF-domain-containing protein [Melanomma pulvis-pyrius CBS 109.77]|uniref:Non-homologous end-joining factor 1 n=1 Tax=Melanomma pulvis-pyrius CBS 109.77 TaxID=1314802 RepID=A0A6A6WUJ9_9PLEO|nr:XLF-domain-containing protein [Melanomma pulvis-pyrius CBS 109.77]